VAAERSSGARASVANYMTTFSPARPFGLVFGFPKPSSHKPCPGEGILVPRLIAALTQGVPVGAELRAPADVVLDPEEELVLHPTIAVAFARGTQTLRSDGSIWGAPDLIVELCWPAVARRLRCAKLSWYFRYGVRECWLVNPSRNRIEIISLAAMKATNGTVLPTAVPHLFSGDNPIASTLLPNVQLTASTLFRDITVREWSTTRSDVR
jgi:Uma2 family endonuclease